MQRSLELAGIGMTGKEDPWGDPLQEDWKGVLGVQAIRNARFVIVVLPERMRGFGHDGSECIAALNKSWH